MASDHTPCWLFVYVIVTLMQSKPLFYLAVSALMLTGAAGILRIIDFDTSMLQSDPQNNSHKSTIGDSVLKANVNHETVDTEPRSPNTSKSRFESILEIIDNGDSVLASNTINEHHEQLSSAELSSLKSALLSLAFTNGSHNISKTKNVLIAISQAFDDLDIWTHLGDAAMSDNDWNIAFDAHLRASQLESDPIDLERLLKKLIVSSGHLRGDFESNGDLLSIKNLYQRLSDLHPHFQRFQYELAVSSLNLGDIASAKQRLELLIYDPELGQVSQDILAGISNQLTEKPDVNIESVAPQRDIRTNDIVVPLIPVGSSFIVDSAINRTRAQLLLDTGASITSLSTQLIERLKLQATGQSIRLSTANGITRAKIYQLPKLRLGELVLTDMLIAEISLSNNGNFQGLLGTDALNQLKPKYSYLIDNRENALIFRPR